MSKNNKQASGSIPASDGPESVRQPNSFTDAELLDALEEFVKIEPLVIWDANREQRFPGRNGVGLAGLAIREDRSLRKALEVIARWQSEAKGK